MKTTLIFIISVFLFSKTFSQSVKTYKSFKQAINDSVNVKKLTLSGDSLKQFSSAILKLTNLEEIAFESDQSFDVSYAIPILAKLKNLKKLWISDIKVVNLNGIRGLKNLEELDLDNVSISFLPLEISNLEKLREINLEENPQLNMIQVFNVLSRIKTLKVLWLGKNNLSTLPKEISKLKTLEQLWLDENDFLDIPLAIRRSKIKYVSMFDNKIEHLNLKRGELTNLNNINLCYNNFKVFPAIELSLLPKLDTIIMWHANIRYIPKQISDIKKLKRLNLEDNSISELPGQMAKLKHLHVLELSGNKLTTDGIKCIYQFKNLTTLELYKNSIKSVSPEIGNLKTLNELSIGENPLTEIPRSISKLKKLKKIQLGYYETFDWTGAISVLGRLPDLKYLGLFKMGLLRMPDGFEKLTSVKEFWMNGNIFENQEKDRLKKLLPNAKFVFN